MPPVTHTIESAHPEAVAKATRALEMDKNGPIRMISDLNTMREPKYYIYIWNVGPIEHTIPRSWAANGRLLIPACPPDKEYSEPVTLPDVIQEPVGIPGSNELRFAGRDGRFYVQDALNPDDPTGSWKTNHAIDTGRSTNMGTNLYPWGVFWSLDNPPTKEQIAKAKERLTLNCNRLITEGDSLWIAQQATGYQGDRVGHTHHVAAEWLQIETAWHRKYRRKNPCPGCGELLDEGVIICPKCPATFDWARAVALGLRTKKQALDAGQELA
jgi:hypothetical protein